MLGVVKRQGKWRLNKVRKGLYSITHRNQKKAEIITDDFEPSNNPLGAGGSILSERIEVSDFQEAKRAFKNYIEKQESGLSLF